nr:sigma-70 family RNA polymerase sigma factor [Cytophagales bacterium]
MKSFFETSIWPLKNKLYRLAYLWVKDREVASDLLQEVFVKALKHDQRLRRMENPMGWMVRCLKNESMQHHRFTRIYEPLGERELIVDNEEAVETSKEIHQVFKFLADLPEKQRDVFHLREVEGLTYEEIADYMEISVDQVKVNLHRARKSLRKHVMTQRNEQ